MDLPELVSEDSGDDVDADSVACILPDGIVSSLQRAQDLLLGGSSDTATAQSMLAELVSDDPADSSVPPSLAARSVAYSPPLILDTGACPLVGGCPGAAASPLCLGGGPKIVATELAGAV
jgi:hypothetical protein